MWGLLFFGLVLNTSLSWGQFLVPQQQDIVAMYLYNGQDESSFKRQLESTTSLRLKRLKDVLQLSAEQESELDLALRGDMNRFYRDIEVTRKKTQGLDVRNQQDMQKAWQFIQPLRTKITETGIVGENSLFERVLQSILTSEQEESYTQYLADRDAAKMRALAHVALAHLEEAIPLLSSQRQELMELLETATYPRRLRRGMETQFGFSMLAKLPDEKVNQILDKKQYAAFQKFSQQFKNQRGGFLAW